MKYILYVRKSTEDREDRQVLSIESQIEEVQRKFPELKIAEVIKESKSAYKPYNRPEFQRMIDMFENGDADGLLSWHPDRLSREPISGGIIMHLLDQKRIKDMRFASYNFHNSPEGKMMLAMTLSQSKYSSEKLSVDVKRGMVKKCNMGCMPTRPPIGYMPDKTADKGEKRVLKDIERFDLVRKLWDAMLTGQYSVLKIVRLAEEIGLTLRPSKRMPARPMSQNGVYKMFSNIFYTGKFIWNDNEYKGAHEPLISLEEFYRVQEIIGNRHVPRPKRYESLTSGLVFCSCGASIVTDFKKGKYYYVRCIRQKKDKKCHEPPTTLISLETQFLDYLQSIKISGSFHKWAIKNLPQVQEQEKKDRTLEVNQLRKGYDEYQNKLDNLLNLKISSLNSDGSLLSDEEYKSRKAAIIIERDKLGESLSRLTDSADKWAKTLEDAFDTAIAAQVKYKASGIQGKKELLAKIGAKFIMSNGKIQIEAKYPYIIFEKRLPEIKILETRCEQEKSIYGKPKEASVREMICLWSG